MIVDKDRGQVGNCVSKHRLDEECKKLDSNDTLNKNLGSARWHKTKMASIV